MSYKFRNGQLLDAVWRNQVRRLAAGYGWVEGLSASIGGSGGSIEISVDGGQIRTPDGPVSVAGEPIVLPEADPDLDRKDLIVATEGGLDYLRGQLGELAEDENGEELYGFYSPTPAPDDSRNLDGCVIWAVNVPSGTSDGGDLSFEEDLQDRRLEPIIGGESGQEGYARPNINVPNASIEAGGTYDVPIHVSGGDTIRVHSWGVSDESGNTPSGLRVGLVDDSGSMIQSESTTLSRGDPIVEETVSGTTSRTYWIRAENSTGADYEADNGEGIGISAAVEII